MIETLEIRKRKNDLEGFKDIVLTLSPSLSFMQTHRDLHTGFIANVIVADFRPFLARCSGLDVWFLSDTSEFFNLSPLHDDQNVLGSTHGIPAPSRNDCTRYRETKNRG